MEMTSQSAQWLSFSHPFTGEESKAERDQNFVQISVTSDSVFTQICQLQDVTSLGGTLQSSPQNPHAFPRTDGRKVWDSDKVQAAVTWRCISYEKVKSFRDPSLDIATASFTYG